ncbi:MAG: hypothetical protein BEN19_03355 [Epulopiscium sp. Nuni2H_MBin003]|nr:MAG: hypothetical protein BEN19_03355 [Epulopiscium sp. Nuni2H_MBin003]
MNDKEQQNQIDNMYNAILLLENKQECEIFFRDLCTKKELQAMAQRLAVAKMLQNKQTYIDIQKSTNASTTTISRVNRTLAEGVNGYKFILDKLEEWE